MNEIVSILNSKLPMELVNRILYEFGGLQSPVTSAVKREIVYVYSNRHTLHPDHVFNAVYPGKWLDWTKLRYFLYYERLMSGRLSSWNANQMIARLARDLLENIDAGNDQPFWDPAYYTPGEADSEVWMKVMRTCHLPQLPIEMDPNLTFEDRVDRIRLIVDREGYSISESMIKSLAQIDNSADYDLMLKSLNHDNVLSRILTFRPFIYKPHLNSVLDYPEFR